MPWPVMRDRIARGARCGLMAALLGVACAAPALGDLQRMLEAAQRAGPQAQASVRDLQALLAQAAGWGDEQRLQAFNEFFNRRVLFRDDQAVWGQVDYWASPVETLARGQGDCEDYAASKYFSLLLAGVAPARLRLVYVRAEMGGPGGPVQAHMVLAYYAAPEAEPLILDNLVGSIRPASRRPDLTPVFSFNAEGLWQGSSGPAAGSPVERLSRWRELLRKARDEGFQ